MTEVRVPTLGESVTEATVATWFKKPGDAVAQDEMLCELETDKVTVEVPVLPQAHWPISLLQRAKPSVLMPYWANISEGAGAAALAPAAAPSSDAGAAVDVMVPTLGESA